MLIGKLYSLMKTMLHEYYYTVQCTLCHQHHKEEFTIFNIKY